MTQGLWPVLTGRPSTQRWDFGGYRHGLEPLTLPPPGAWQPSSEYDGTDSCTRLSLIEDFGVPAELAEPREAADELFWFRWITGHQVSFILWRLMGQLVHDATTRRAALVAALAPLRHYVRGYCAMLLYTGSCPRPTYERLIRPSMRLHHPSFSGSWAPDFWPVKDLLRARRTVFTGVLEAAELVEAIRLHQRVHDAVAARLVPDGESLLRRSSVRSWDMHVVRLMYDNYFLTMRATIAEHDVVAQLLRRLVAIARDFDVNGLYPPGSADVQDRTGHVWTADVAACEDDIAEILDEVANSAIRVPGSLVEVRPLSLT